MRMHEYMYSFHSFINGSTALCWPLAYSSVSHSFYTDGETPWTSDQPVARTSIRMSIVIYTVQYVHSDINRRPQYNVSEYTY
jgi:hypothetical protein